jgi:hypothetical protein
MTVSIILCYALGCVGHREVWGTIQKVADVVQKAVDAVVTIIKVIVTGDFDYDKDVSSLAVRHGSWIVGDRQSASS